MPTPLRRALATCALALLAALGVAPDLPAQPRADSLARAARSDSLQALVRGLLRDEASDPTAMRRALAAAEEAMALEEGLGRPRAGAYAFFLRARAFDELGMDDSALTLYRGAARRRRAAGDLAGEAVTTNNMGVVHAELARHDSALAHYRRAVELARAAARAPGADTADVRAARDAEALALGNVGIALRDLAQPESAATYFHQALRLARELDAPERMDANLIRLAELHEVARPDSGIHYYRLAYELGRRTGAASREGWAAYGIAWIHYQAEWFDSAATWLAAATDAYERAGDSSGVAMAVKDLGNVEYARGDQSAALVHLRRALRLYRAAGDEAEIGHVHLNLARVHEVAGATDSARRHLAAQTALAAARGDAVAESEAYVMLAGLLGRVGVLDSAELHVRRALALARAADDGPSVARALHGLGEVEDRRGRTDSALVHYYEAARLRGEAEDWSAAAWSLIFAGNQLAMFRNLTDSARTVLLQARTLAERSTGVRDEARVLADLANVERIAGRADSSRAYALQALELLRRTGGDRALMALVLETLAELHPQRDSALAHAREALSIARESGELLRITGALATIASTHWRFEAADSALAPLQEALALARDAGNHREEARVLQLLGTAHKLASPPRWELAAAYYDSSWAVTDQVRARAGDDAARLAFAELNANSARHLSSAWQERAKETGSPEQRWLALAAMERARARTLLDLMRGDVRTGGAGDLRREAAELREALERPGLATLSYAVGAEWITITVTSPSRPIETWMYEADYLDVIGAVAAVREGLQVDGAVARATGTPLEEAPDAGTRGLGRGGAKGGGAALDARLRTLAAFLLPDSVLQRLAGDTAIRELVVVTDFAVALTPFAALPFGDDGTPLGVRFPVRYAPSLTALVEAERRPHAVIAPGRPVDGALVVGNPAMPAVGTATGTRARLAPLPGAEREAAVVARALGASVLRGAQATESEVRRRLPDAPVVHLATHGYAYAAESRQRDSFVALAPDGRHDGLLTVGEVLDADVALRADLVVLSACQTGLGARMIAEGTVGLQRAFLARGARSLLVSLWSVDDATTERLMTSFYAHWRAGATKAEALRRAQDEVRRTHPSPRYWAAFQLVGAS